MFTLTVLAAIQGPVLVHAVIWLIVLGLIFGLLYWLIKKVALPEPFNHVAEVVLAILAVLALINVLLSIVGKSFIEW